jgi:hypothetical protein
MPLPTEEIAKLCRSWTPQGLAAFYELVFSAMDPPWKLPDHLWPVILGLCDTRIRKLMLIVGPGSGKSQLLSVVFPAWVAGHDPNMTILGVSGGEALMQGFQSAVMEIVERSDAWKLVFPNVAPDKGAGWSNDKGMFVSGRRPGIPDATYLAAGLQSRYLVGKHAKLMVIDDLHDENNSATEEQCKTVVNKYYSTLLGRADPMGARFILAGRRWHENDIYGSLQRSNDWVVMTLPAERAGKKSLYFDVTVPDNLDCVFTDRLVVCADKTEVRI